MIANTVLSTFLVFNIIWSYFIRKKWKVVTGSLLTIDDMPTDMKIDMTVEWLLNLVMPYPPLYNTTFREYEYSTKSYVNIRIDTVLLFLMFIIRFYHVIRPILLSSLYMESRAHRICKVYGHEWTMMFSAKSIFTESAALLMPLMYALFVVIVGTLLHIWELQAY